MNNLQQEYPIGHELVCIKTYSPQLDLDIFSGESKLSNHIVFKDEFGTILESDHDECVVIKIDRLSRDGNHSSTTNYVHESVIDMWRLVP